MSRRDQACPSSTATPGGDNVTGAGPTNDNDHPPPLWDPATGRFDGPRLRREIVRRGWTVPEFAREAGYHEASGYSWIKGNRVYDRTALRIARLLGTRQPTSALV